MNNLFDEVINMLQRMQLKHFISLHKTFIIIVVNHSPVSLFVQVRE